MRTGLGKALDEALQSFVPDLLEPVGFRAINRPRTWQRTDDVVEQILAIEVDGRSAPDGYLELWVTVGLTYRWEQASELGWVLAGRHPRHGPGRLQDHEQRWRFTSAYGLTGKPALSEFLSAVAVPALDRWRDPASMRNHYLSTGRLKDAIDLSTAIGDTDLARRLVPALVESIVRRLQSGQPTQSPSMAGTALTIADDLGIQLDAADRTFLLSDMAATIDRWRNWHDPLPAWVADLETRFLSD